jgi:hypothetical protein
MRLCLFLLFFLAAPVLAEPLQLSLSGGIGHSHSILGPRLELAGDHFGGFTAASIAFLHGDLGIAAGARWTSGVRRGLVLSLQADVLEFGHQAHYLFEDRQTLVVISATVGYRFRYQRFWAEAAIGPAFYIDSHYHEGAIDENQTVFQRQTGFGAFGGQNNPRLPDIELAIGF